MSIRVKLFIIVLSTILSFMISIAVYVIISSPIKDIEKEEVVLLKLKEQLLIEEIELNKLGTHVFESQMLVYKESTKASNEAYDQLASIVVLPKKSKDIKQALEIISNLKALLLTRRERVNKALDKVHDDAKKVFAFTDSFNIQELLLSEEIQKISNAVAIIEDIKYFNESIKITSLTLKTSINDIDEQFKHIFSKIEEIKKRSTFIGACIILIVIMFNITISMILTNRIAKNMKRISEYVSIISDGDFTKNIDINTRDEIFILAENIKKMINIKLKGTIVEIKSSSQNAVSMQHNLESSSSETAEALGVISLNIDTISNQVVLLNNQLAKSTSAIGTIISNITNLNNLISTQSTAVNESSASVEEMISSITNIADITAQRKEETNKLLINTQDGERQFNATHSIIENITNSISDIASMIKIINNISAEVDLLAMNSAIEAAHAGDAGKGFSIVADEIRKLAESSRKNANNINSVLSGVIINVNKALESSNKTRETFSLINNDTYNLIDFLSEITSATKELSIGSEQIIIAISSLSEVSHNVNDNSSQIKEETNEINSSMCEIKNITDDITNGMEGIVEKISMITSSMNIVGDLCNKLGDIASILDKEVCKFKTE